MRVLEVLAEHDGTMSRREIERAAYPLKEFRDLAVASAIGWLVNRGWIEKSRFYEGRYALTSSGRAALNKTRLGLVLVDGDDGGNAA